MTFIPLDDRQGNLLPPVVDQDSRLTLDREDMLYSYQNTVASSYVGDIRVFVSKMGDYLKTKNAYYDVKKQEYIEFPIRYSAPNLVFSDNKGLNGVAEEASIKDRIVLPIISYYLKGMNYDNKRAIDPCVRYWYKPDKNNPGKLLATTAPKAMVYNFQVDIWMENREPFYQVVSAVQLDFNPYSYLTDLYTYVDETQKSFYIPYAKMTLQGFTDASNFVPGTDRRLVRGTFNIDVEGYLSQPPKQENYVYNTTTNMNTEIDTTTKGTGNMTTGNNVTIINGVPMINPSYVTLAGNGVDTNILIKHNLNSPSVVVEVWEMIGDMKQIFCATTIVNNNSIILHFTHPPAFNSIKVVVISSEVLAQQNSGASHVTVDVIPGLSIAGESLQDVLVEVQEKIANDTFTVSLSQAMSVGSLFRIINNKAYLVKSIDSTVPFIDGILLAAGNLNDVVLAGRKTNAVYTTTTHWTTDSILYLSQTGTLTTTVPDFAVGDKYGLIVGRSLVGTTSIIFDPKGPVKLG